MTTSRRTTQDAREAFAEKDYETVLDIVDDLFQADEVTLEVLDLARNAHWKMGELHRSLGVLNRMRRLSSDDRYDAAARTMMGRIIESAPTWQPTLEPEAPPAKVDDRVLHILKESLPYVETGFTMRSRMTLEAQRLAGLDPQVVTSLGFPYTRGHSPGSTTETVHGVTHHRLDEQTLDVAALPYDVLGQRTAELMADVARQVAPAAVQAGTGYRGFDTALPGIAIADRHEIPFVYEVRGFQEQTWTSNVERSEHGEYYHRRRRQENRCMERADTVITIAEAMAEEILRRGAVDEDRLAVVPNAVDVERFSPRPKRDDLLDTYGLRDRPVVGYISNLGAREGIDQLLLAVDILRRRTPDIACFIAGGGPERRRLEALVEARDLASHVVLAGHVPNDQIEDHYALIDIFVVPRIDDRAARLVTPLKPLEAMSMRLPVVVSSLPALEELVEPGVRGLSFPPSNPDAIADTVSTLIADEPLRRQYAQAGHAWVHEDRTIQANAARYEQILRPLL